MAIEMKICRNCGTQVSKNIQKCPICGNVFEDAPREQTPAPENPAPSTGSSAPAARFCRKCGKELSPGAKFCKNCGASLAGGKFSSQSSSAPTPAPTVRTTYSSAGKTSANDSKPKKKSLNKGNKRAIAIIVAAAIFGVTAFKYPGFLVKDNKPGGGYSTDFAHNNNNQTGSGDSDSVVPTEEWSDSLFDASKVKIEWSKDEIENATPVTEKVSPDNPQVQCGSVNVQLNGWNLQEEDEIIVRELSEKTDSKAGVIAKAYDFSLASGQSEFLTYVDLNIPRESQDEIGYCEYYNEETGSWEDVSYEISEDGSSYTIYTKHFSLYRKLKLTDEALAKINSAKIRAKDLGEESIYNYFVSFVECYRDSSGQMQPFHKTQYDPNKVESNYMMMPVEFIGRDDRFTMDDRKDPDWAKYWAGLEQVEELAAREANDSQYNGAALLGDILGYTGLGSDITDVSGGQDKIKELIPKSKNFFKGAGVCLLLVGLLYTTCDIKSKMGQGEGFWDYAFSHKLDAIGTGLSALGVAFSFMKETTVLASAAATGGTVITVGTASTAIACVSIGLFVVTTFYTTLQPRDLAVPERVYRDYYASPFVGQRYFYFKAQQTHQIETYGTIPRIACMSKEDAEKFEEAVNSAGGLKGAPCPDGGNDFVGADHTWANAITALYTIYEDRPEQLKEAIVGLYETYANIYWDLGPEFHKYFGTQDMTARGYDASAYVEPNEALRKQYTENLVTELMGAHASLYEKLSQEYCDKAKKAVDKAMKEEVLPRLNAKMTFVITDSVAQPEVTSIKESNYATPLKDIKGNAEEFAYDPEAYSDFNNVEAPMRFAIENESGGYHLVDSPYFVPARYGFLEGVTAPCSIPEMILTGDSTWYYPFNEAFIPQLQSDNVIFQCTFYHYLMMGAPTVLVLHDIDGKLSDIPIYFELPDPEPDGSFIVNIGNDGVTLHSFKGDWLGTIADVPSYIHIGVDGYRQLVDFDVIKKDHGHVNNRLDTSEFKLDAKEKKLILYPSSDGDYDNKFENETIVQLIDDETIRISAKDFSGTFRKAGEDEDYYLDW